ncbi:MAG: hypothetical protein JXA68_00175 [Ignavibacteriales bacterium]|nr:hypothetical protein [Ignavibacteriales bacterium]
MDVHELITLASALLDEATIIEWIEEQIAKYKRNPTPAQWQELCAFLSIALAKTSIRTAGEGDVLLGLQKVLQEFEKMKIEKNLFNPNKS